MHASTDKRPLKVLIPQLADRLRVFNSASRTLQAMGIRMHRIDPVANLLVISPEDGQRLQRERLTEGYQRHPSAGSTRYTVMFHGVSVEWREPISYRDLISTTPNSIDLTFH
jgi:hypothetical protein